MPLDVPVALEVEWGWVLAQQLTTLAVLEEDMVAVPTTDKVVTTIRNFN